MSLLHGSGPRMRVQDFRLLRDFINRICGISLGDEMQVTVERKLSERLTTLGLGSFADYYQHLRYHPERRSELERAVDMLTTNETYFFRESFQLNAFRDEVLPVLRELRASKRSLAIWSAGCSTGEEVYTLAILIKQTGLFDDWDVRVFGNDISRRVIQAARGATYGESSFRAMPPEYERYFLRTSQGRIVDPRIRAMCQFGHFNLLDQARAVVVGRADAVFCRNVLMYFDAISKKQVIQTFFQRLVPGGFLMLGHSESLLSDATAFELAHLSSDLVYRKPLTARHNKPSEVNPR